MGTGSDVETELGRFRLPVSGREVSLRHAQRGRRPAAAEAARTPGGDAALALALASRLTRAVDGGPIDWGTLSVTDLDALVLRLRQALIGDRVRADLACPAPGCGRRIDIDFRIAEFLAHHAPQADQARDRAGLVGPAEEPGWFCLARTSKDPDSSNADPSVPGPVRFRLPTAEDLLAVAGHPAAECRSWPAAASGRPRSPRGSATGRGRHGRDGSRASPATCRGPAPSAGPRSPCTSMPDGSACASCATAPRSSTRTSTSWPGATTGPRRRSCRCRRSGAAAYADLARQGTGA